MEVEMALSTDGAMPGCDGCGAGNDGDLPGKLVCAPACIALGTAVLGSDTMVVVKVGQHVIPLASSRGTGRPTLLDPYPPRPRVLI